MIALIILITSLVIVFTSTVLYSKKGWFKSFYHDILGWCEPDPKEILKYDGCNIHAICRHCRKNIMQDSQGNWF